MKQNTKPIVDLGRLLSKIGTGQTVLEHPDHVVVFSQGDPADAIFYIRTGRVKLTIVSPAGKGAVVAILGPGDFFGEGCLARHQPHRNSTATSISKCSLIRLPRSGVLEAVQHDPILADQFLTCALSYMARLEEELANQVFSSSERRLARTLLMLVDSSEDPGSSRVVPRITQELLAEVIGTTRSRVTFFMNKFRRQGLITYNGRGALEVHHSLRKAFTISVTTIDRKAPREKSSGGSDD